MVARCGILLVAGFVLLVDDDETERIVGNRRKYRTARAHDDVGATIAQQRPLLVALRVGEAGVKDGDIAVGEARGDAADGLRRERDFGHEQDRALAARDAFLEQADVDFGFARASDAEHEVLRELAKIAGNRGDCRLLLIGRRGRGRDVPRTGDEAGFHRSLAGGDQMASGDEALERFVGRVARGLGEVGDFDRTRKRREHVERVLLFLRDLREAFERWREVDERALDAADRLADGGGKDRREGHADRARVVRADPAGKLHEFAGEDDARWVLPKDGLDLLTRKTDVLGRGDVADDPSCRWRLASAERHFDTRAIGKVREGRGQRVGETVGRAIDGALDGDDDELQILRDGVGSEERHAARSLPIGEEARHQSPCDPTRPDGAWHQPGTNLARAWHEHPSRRSFWANAYGCHARPGWRLVGARLVPGTDGLGEEAGYHFACNVSEPIVATLVLVGQPLVVDAHQPQNRRVQIVHMHPAIEDAVAEIIGRSVHMSFQLGRRSRR